MGLQSLEPPAMARKSKYDFSPAEAQEALDLLAEGGSPGDGPYEKEGQARSAGNALIRQVAAKEQADKVPQDERTELGCRVWETDDGFLFALKLGRKKRKAKDAAAETATPAAAKPGKK